MRIHEGKIFSYQEVLDDELLKDLPNALLLNDPVFEGIIIRLLLGTIDIRHNYTDDIIHQRINYSSLGKPEVNLVNLDCITKEIPLDDPELFNRYINSNRRNNMIFENLLSEYSNYFYQRSKGSHISAFVHLYRSIEFISYTFPLVYASKSKDYSGTYNHLKSFFVNDKGELNFFKTFLNTVIEPDILQLRYTIRIISPEGLEEENYKLIKKICSLIGSDFTDDGNTISIPYRDFLSFTIELRNRFFHMLTGKDTNNIKTTAVCMDYIFSSVNEEIANWIAYIYFEILKYGIENA